MKKIISLIILLFVGATLFTGCSSNVVGENQVDLNNNQNDIVAESNSEKQEVAKEETKLTPPALPED
jgi:hypothetical protein